MIRISKTFRLKDISSFKKKLLKWSEKSATSVFLNSNNHKSQINNYEAILALDSYSETLYTRKNSLNKLDDFLKNTQDWVFGYLSYDLKNELENLESKNIDSFDLPNLFFFQPKKIWLVSNSNVEALYLDGNEIDNDWIEINEINLSIKFSKSNKIKLLLDHINRGDIYEANFCMEWFSQNANIIPSEVYVKLNKISKTPMSAFFKNKNLNLLSSSPERYIKRIKDRVVSQPIKGTSRRDLNEIVDSKLMKELEANIKERSENIMIVDLIRNDLSRFSIPGSVIVKELCKVYPFKQVHQMISTVESKIKSDLSSSEIIKHTFPMGSMTGAPKVKAMKIIEDLEVSARGLYSGALGYIKPSGDFDFNVVIRSLIYDTDTKYLSFHVGSAITSKSKISSEYDECLLKAEAMISVLK